MTEGQQGAGDIGPGEQKCRKVEDLLVPERRPLIGLARQAAGADRQMIGIGRRRDDVVVEAESQRHLGGRVAVDTHIRRRPLGVPDRRVVGLQAVVSVSERPVHGTERRRSRVGDIVARIDRHDLDQFDGAAGRQGETRIPQNPPVLPDHTHRLGPRTGKRHPFRHHQADTGLFGGRGHHQPIAVLLASAVVEMIAVQAPDLTVDPRRQGQLDGAIRNDAVAHGQQVNVGIAGEPLAGDGYGGGPVAPDQVA